MASRILELDRAHQRQARRPERSPTPRRPASTGPVHDPVGPSAQSARARGGARPFTAIDVTVPGIVGPIRQASSMACWATVYTMMVNWRFQRSEPVESAIAAVGARWSQVLAANTGLSASQKVDFLADAGMVALPPQNPMISRWAQMLENYGPLWVTTDEAPPNLMIHARILTAMRGDGTAEGTMLTLVDPGPGTVVTERFTEFLRKFEAEAGNPHGQLRVQIVHWPAGARAFSRPRGRAMAVEPNLLHTSARTALLTAMTSRGIPPGEAQQLIANFEAEVLGAGNRPIPLSWGHVRALDVPTPDSGDDPRETAREILSFFYPGRTFASITDDHGRLAARMFHSALEKQRMLNRLPEVPSSPPTPSWLAQQAVKILWREIRGVNGFSVMTRNAVALQWRTTLEEIENGLPPTALGIPGQARGLTLVEQQGLSDWINNPDIPLSPAVGGMSLDHSALRIGDIIVSTTEEAPSIAIRRIGSPVSHVMLYVGGGQVVEAIGEGVVLRSLSEALAGSYVGVAFRHPNITDQQALMVRDYVGQQIGRPYAYDLILAHGRYQLGRMACEQLPASLRDRCLATVGPVDTGTGTDQRFICSSLVAQAFAHADAPLLPIAAAANPGDIAQSTALIYLGHVKYDPPAGLASRLRRL